MVSPPSTSVVSRLYKSLLLPYCGKTTLNRSLPISLYFLKHKDLRVTFIARSTVTVETPSQYLHSCSVDTDKHFAADEGLCPQASLQTHIKDCFQLWHDNQLKADRLPNLLSKQNNIQWLPISLHNVMSATDMGGSLTVLLLNIVDWKQSLGLAVWSNHRSLTILLRYLYLHYTT